MPPQYNGVSQGDTPTPPRGGGGGGGSNYRAKGDLARFVLRRCISIAIYRFIPTVLLIFVYKALQSSNRSL